jgi:hypothetical protein
MMLDGHELATQQSEQQRHESWAGQMNNIRRADRVPQLKKTRLTKNTKRKHRVVEFFAWRLRDNCDFEFGQIRFRVDLSEPPSHCEDDSFCATNARSEIVRTE